MTIGETIKFYRKEKELTQGQLAELIGVSTQAVSKWETDTGMPDSLEEYINGRIEKALRMIKQAEEAK